MLNKKLSGNKSKSPASTKLSVVIPVYNEKKTIVKLLDQVQAVPLSQIDVELEIVLVDDCSTDGTHDILKSLTYSNLKIVYHEKNQGKGAAIRTGLQHISGAIVLIQDADLEYQPNDYIELVKPILEEKASVVYGSRIRGRKTFGTTRHSSINYYLGGRLLSVLTNLLYNANITDEATCYKVFKSEVFKTIPPLTCQGFEFCPEVTAKVLLSKYPIYEVPIHYYPRSREDGKKITWQDGFIAIRILFKYRTLAWLKRLRTDQT